MKRSWPFLVSLILLTLPPAAPAASPAAAPAPAPADEYLAAKAEDLAWWREARFGLFIHWGPVSLKGTEIGWSRGGERRGRKDKSTGAIPAEVYDNLYKEFNPTKFNAREWVETARAAGMKYLVFTTKHHDGFCEFDSKLTDYKITNSPFKRDVVAELSAACRDAGLRLGFYYSPPDWHHPDYRTANHAKYVEYMHGQIRELCTNYGRLDIMWFDGLGGRPEDWDSPALFRIIRTLQPHILINNRAGLPADFDTPEQRIGAQRTDRPWETCMTICRQWAWKPDDQMKSLKECLDVLVRCAGGDGNLLFNVGPMPTGEIEPRQVQRLKEMGRWLAAHGETIYGTRGGPWRPGPWGAATSKGNTAYVHILKWEGEKAVLAPIGRKVLSAAALTGGRAEVRQTDEAVEIAVAPADRQELDTIVALALDGPAFEAKVRKAASASLAVGKQAAASNVFQGNAAMHGADKAFDDDPETRWATDAGTRAATLQVDLGKPETVGRAVICEAYAGRIQEFAIEYQKDGRWQEAARGRRAGENAEVKFPAVAAQVWRLNILKAGEGPTIWEFQLFAAK